MHNGNHIYHRISHTKKFLQQTVFNPKRSAIVIETDCVLCKLRTKHIHIIQIKIRLQRVKVSDCLPLITITDIQSSYTKQIVLLLINSHLTDTRFFFSHARSQNYERRLLASSGLFVCLSVPMHGTTRLLLDGFSWNLIFEYFSKICRENSNFIKTDQNKGHFTWKPTYSYDHMSLNSC
jgi:hypothetical protein